MQGLVLTAGGARGAYQAGVLRRLGEIPALCNRPQPFAVVSGASAGAINGSILAARGARFGEATREIARIWSELRVGDVFRTDALALARSAASLAFDFTLGARLGHT
ncbi:MAG TPA: patatin-like phospholipase family protein, partial [Myxococcota bacterium]|nr:patatin-like phospholipase family protein [Myxococcota bacterium]